jgi:hypothetical protein
MATMNISIPDEMKAFVEEAARSRLRVGAMYHVAVPGSGRMKFGYPTKYGRVRAEYWPLPTRSPPAV